MYEEVFEGMNYTNKEIADMFNKTFVLNECDEYDGMRKNAEYGGCKRY